MLFVTLRTQRRGKHMKKVVLLVLLICAVVAHYANLAILSSHLSVTNKAICLISFSSGFSSVALLVTLVWLGTWSTTKKPDGLNRLATLAAKERVILARVELEELAGKDTKKTIRLQDEWEELNEQDIANYKNFLSNH